MADGLSIVVQSEASDKVREYGQAQFMEGIGIKPNDNISSAPINEDTIQLRLTSNGNLYYWDGNSWEIISLGAIIAQSLNLGNTNLSLTSARRLNGNGFSLLIDNIPVVEIDTTNLVLKGGVFTLRTSTNPYFIFRIDNENGIDLDFSLLTAQRNLKAPDSNGVIATESYVQQTANSLATFPLTSNSSGIITSSLLVGKKIGTIMGASTPFEEGYQFVKPTSGDTILDASTYDPDAPSNDPFIFLTNQKYFLTPIVP